jgi:type I restriction enzyme S subunit
MAEFLRIPVRELVKAGEVELKTGPFGTQLKASDYTEQGTPVINVRNIGFGGIRTDKLEFISTATRNRLSSHVLKAGDIVFGRKGAVERHVFIRTEQNGWFQGSDCLRLRFASQRVEPLFASYYFLTSEHQRWMMNQCSHGATMASLNQEVLERIELPLPPISIQRRIAGILSAYDELIENSQRRIKILEETARALYREWFVHFRFPGQESVPLVPSSLGKIPQGWEVKKLAAVAEVNRAQITPRTAPEALHYIDISSVSPGQIDSITTFAFADAPGRARRIIQHGDVLWSCVRPNRRSHAQVMHPEPNTIASTGFAVLSPMKVPFTFLYFATTTDDFVAFLTNNATGAAYPAITSKTFENADLVIPPPPLLREFGNLTSPMAEQVHGLQLQIQNLRRTRDLLLPRLLTGQIALETLPGLSAEEQDSCLN